MRSGKHERGASFPDTAILHATTTRKRDGRSGGAVYVDAPLTLGDLTALLQLLGAAFLAGIALGRTLRD